MADGENRIESQQIRAGIAAVIGGEAASYSTLDSRVSVEIPTEKLTQTTRDLIYYTREGRDPVRTHKELKAKENMEGVVVDNTKEIDRVFDLAGFDKNQRQGLRIYARQGQQSPTLRSVNNKDYLMLVTRTEYIISRGEHNQPEAVVIETITNDTKAKELAKVTNDTKAKEISKNVVIIKGRPSSAADQSIGVRLRYSEKALDSSTPRDQIVEVNKRITVGENSVTVKTFTGKGGGRVRFDTPIEETYDAKKLREMGSRILGREQGDSREQASLWSRSVAIAENTFGPPTMAAAVPDQATGPGILPKTSRSRGMGTPT